MLIVTTIPAGTFPSWVSVDPTPNLIYVADWNPGGGPGSVTVINGATNTVQQTIKTGGGTRSVAVNPTTHLAYSVSQTSSIVQVIDITKTKPIVATLPGLSHPWHIALNPALNRAYVTEPQIGQVMVLDTSPAPPLPPQLVAILLVGRNDWDAVVDPTTNRFYVGTAPPAKISVFDGNTNALIATIPISTTDSAPDRMAINSTTHRLYISIQGPSDNETVIDTQANQVVATVPLSGVPDGVAVDPTTNQIYVGDVYSDGYLWQIDGATNTVVSQIVPGQVPLGVTYDPTSNIIYTANAYGNNVSVISLGGP
jgi:YVTN family beta-propeller protein